MREPLHIYLIRTRKDRYVIFAASDSVARCENESGDHVRQGIAWVASRKTRPVAWFGRVLKKAHVYYVQLEDRLDPVERVLKAIACSRELVVHHAPELGEAEASAELKSIMRKQRIKHTFWLVLDALFAPATLLLAPIPGPNVIGYYPCLRAYSHWRALRGTASALGSMPVQFKSLPDLSGLEENLQTPRFDRDMVRNVMERLKVRGLDQFLERMV
jgi:hypothetical protein